jgi:hypothetical protein
MPKGGSYKSVRATNTGGEVHHIPAYGSYEGTGLLPYRDGPAIWMDRDDHRNTTSCGRTKDAINYRAQQEELINQGKFQEAQQMDVDDIRSQFGDKYDVGLNEAENYTGEHVDPSIFVSDHKPELPSAETPQSPDGNQDKAKGLASNIVNDAGSQLKGDYGQKPKTLTSEAENNTERLEPQKNPTEDSKPQLKGDYGQKAKDSLPLPDSAESSTESDSYYP